MSSGIHLKVRGDWKKTEKFLLKASNFTARRVLAKYGEKGVRALSAATPMDTGKTASSWSYNIEGSDGNWSIIWTNSNINKNVNIALILQMGHGTRNGGYVVGVDYINPALRSVFEAFADEVWKEVTSDA